MKNKKSLSLPFLISLSFHGTVGLVLALQPNGIVDKLKAPAPKAPAEVELLDVQELAKVMKNKRSQPALPHAQIVEQDEKRINDETPDDARFLSRHNQKVVRETQAQLHGKFKNSETTGGEKKAEQKVGKPNDKAGEEAREQEQVAKEKPDQLQTSPDGLVSSGRKPTLKDLTPSFKPGLPRVETEEVAQGGGEGPSATDDHLKNVQTGMQTLLSTREFVYYSYYNRIKDKLRQYWEPKIKEKMERIMRQGRTIASNDDRITRIIIILDGKGTLQRIQVMSPSGVQDLDDAAVEAFRAAAPFPNPPKGIVESDGTIKIRWDFILEANASGIFDGFQGRSKVL